MMRGKLFAAAAAVSLLFSVPTAALEPQDFSGGALSGIAADGEAVMVTDTYNKVIWRVEGNDVARYAGKIGVSGVWGEPVGAWLDGPMDSAMFLEPWAVAPYLDGYAVTDAGANVIRYLDGETVRTAAGSGKAGVDDGKGADVTFDRPTGLAAGPDGELYIADTGSGLIRKMDADGTVTTWASGLVEPTGLCWADGELYVAETGRSRICRISDGEVIPLNRGDEPDENGVYPGGYTDGPVGKARFEHPLGVAVGEDGTIYVADTGNGAVRMIRDGLVTTLAAMRQTPAAPVEPKGLLLRGDELLVTDSFAQIVLTLSVLPTEYADVAEDTWYAAAVARASLRGLTVGTGNGMFSPNLPVTRGMLVTMLSSLHLVSDGTAVIGGKNGFSDLADHPWYENAACWAADQGFAQGSGDAFNGNGVMTREEVVSMLYRYAEINGYSVDARGDLSRFTDGDGVSEENREAMAWAESWGVIHGRPDGTLAPGETATRAQAIQILINFMDAMGL